MHPLAIRSPKTDTVKNLFWLTITAKIKAFKYAGSVASQVFSGVLGDGKCIVHFPRRLWACELFVFSEWLKCVKGLNGYSCANEDVSQISLSSTHTHVHIIRSKGLYEWKLISSFHSFVTAENVSLIQCSTVCVCVGWSVFRLCVHTNIICMRAVCSYLLLKHPSAHPACWLAGTWRHNYSSLIWPRKDTGHTWKQWYPGNNIPATASASHGTE